MTLYAFIILLSLVGAWNVTDAWFSIVTWLGKPTPTNKPIHDLVIRVIRGLLGLVTIWLAFIFGKNMIG